MSENLYFNFMEESDSDSDSNLDSEYDLTLQNEILDTNGITVKNEIIDEYAKHVNYKINYTVKQLLVICDYYNISKNIKLIKANKDDIITNLISFENNPDNYNIVNKRKQLWYYMEELKNDKFMKKFIMLWQ
jgi:hypothetical protein